MPTVFYVDNKGIDQPFEILKRDGITPKNLTGLTITWTFQDRDDNNLSPITCVITSASLGLCEGTIPASFFTAVNKYRCQIHMTDGINYTEDSRYFWVLVEESNS